MDINDFLAISVVGALLSLVIEWLTNVWGTERWATKMVTLLFAIVVGGFYIWARNTAWFPTMITVLGAASIVYGFFLNKKPNPLMEA